MTKVVIEIEEVKNVPEVKVTFTPEIDDQTDISQLDYTRAIGWMLLEELRKLSLGLSNIKGEEGGSK